VRCDFS